MGNCISIDLSLDTLIERCCVCASGQVVYIWNFENNLEVLKTATNQLRASKNDLMQRVRNEEGPQLQRLQQVQVWFDLVDQKLDEFDQLIKDAEKEIDEKLCLGSCCSKNCKSSYVLGKRVADTKLEVDALKQDGVFDVVVERAPAEPGYLHQLKNNLEALEGARNGLNGLKKDVLRRVNREEGPQMNRLKQVEVWFSRVDALIIQVDALIRDGPQEIEKWSVGNFSNAGFGDRVAERLNDVTALKEEGIFEVVVERIPVEPAYISQLEDKLEALQTARDELWGLKEDVMRRVILEEGQQKKRLQQVQVWLSSVEALIPEVDTLLKDGKQEIKKLHLGDFSNSLFGEKVGKRLENVADLKGKGVFQEVADLPPPEAVVELDSGPTVGLETKLKEVWSWIMRKEVGIVGLFGMGGVGKTTLLTQINNKFLNTPNDFDFVIWVVVSRDLKLSKVQEEIGERIGISGDEWKKKNIDEKAKDISNVLRKKKFVLLLDDLWERVNFAKAGVPIPKRQNGSKIVLTTRSELVCSLMDAQKRIKVETLPPADAWQLFKEKVGEEALSMDPAIPPLAEQVAEECDGLPLALITIARAMACNKTREEWEIGLKDLQQSVSDSEGMMDEIFPRLKYSYDRLQNDKVKSCFIYCALFPEDFKIFKDDLIDYWVCENFEDDKSNESVTRDRAYRIIRDLVHACLLEEEGKYVKMHDVIRDMVLWVACKLEKSRYNFLVQAGKQLSKAPKIGEKVKRTSVMENSIQNITEVPECPDLLTLFLCRNPRLNDISATFFQSMRALTVLDVSNSRIQELPMGISELGSLQYLNLSRTWIEQMPLEFKMLKRLKYLNVENNEFLSMIPKEVLLGFSALQVLKMFHSGFFYERVEDNILADSKMHIEALQHLEHLNVLSLTIRSANALKLYFSNKNLPSCTRALSLECFSGSKSIDLSPIENMNHLETLQVSASQDLEEIKVESRILREKRCFDHLREVTIEYCARVSNLRWLILAPNLEILKVAVCEKMEEIYSSAKSNEDGDAGDKLKPFGRLEVLVLEGLPQLQSIYWNAVPFPALKRIRVIDCPMLKKLPLKSDNSSKGRKVVIEAEERWWKDLEWEDEDTKTAFQSSFRSCLPRARVCRAPHDYFFDLWKSLSS